MSILNIDMDRICGAVLDRIHALSPAGRYVIIDEDEIFEAFPDGSDKTYDELERVLSVLRYGGYIDLKYSRGDMYCVAPLKEYVEEQSLPPATIEERKQRTDIVFFSAFAGGALGSLIISLIFAVL